MFKRIVRVLLSKTFAFALLALLQIALLLALLWFFAGAGSAAYAVLTIISVLVLLYVQEKDDLNPAYKMMWVLVILLLPLTGAAFYLLWGHRHVPRRLQRRFDEIERRAQDALQQNPATLDALKNQDARLAQTAHYLLHYADAPLYKSAAAYYPTGEVFFPPYLEALRSAKHFIFLEYFIYQEGYMWNTILDVLRKKAAEGVDVRVIYDGFGSLFTLPPGYDKTLRSYGIHCHAFSPLSLNAHVSSYAMLNHRDHRKITVVDGRIAFSGGLNLSDEYININSRFGEWKDTAFRLEGEAVHSLTIAFLKAWDYVSGRDTDFAAFLPAPDTAPPSVHSTPGGFVQPYCDSPLDGENVCENAYFKLISHARRYLYISTPYLILDHEMITSLTLAAKSGVDVRILCPAIPDKKTVFELTQSYYPSLIQAGVKIYAFTPGFNHAKMYVCDDEVAIIGSANMDFRSLYLHFENCAAFYGGPVVAEAKRDMLASFGRSRLITPEETLRVSLFKRLVRIGARFLAPLL